MESLGVLGRQRALLGVNRGLFASKIRSSLFASKFRSSLYTTAAMRNSENLTTKCKYMKNLWTQAAQINKVCVYQPGIINSYKPFGASRFGSLRFYNSMNDKDNNDRTVQGDVSQIGAVSEKFPGVKDSKYTNSVSQNTKMDKSVTEKFAQEVEGAKNRESFDSAVENEVADAKKEYASSPEVKELTGWRKYKKRFQNKPGSHLASFIILHELTAIVPLFALFYLMQTFDFNFHIPQEILDSGDRYISKILEYFGLENSITKGSKSFVYMLTSYAIIKSMLPLRIALCFALTPLFSRFAVEPITLLFKKLSKSIAKR
ncbi:hypothetical protein AYI69_g3953 [Smittium culicis]|uniref:Uncharacterized protein n=1 Tax=Smittium culicis TaxID=133412 RepID=A0A1R1YIA2_9FUNG|nr:hypothetical protein AYI69_g3953 [Smittium culicis]